MMIGAVVRDGEVITPRSTTVIKPGDQVVALVTYRDLRKGEALLAGPGREQA
jgi:trk system potassium uptake protein TrkA